MVQFITDIGFCAGVKNAISKRKEKSEEKNIFLLHPLMHNKIENEKLRKELKATLLDQEIQTFDFPSNSIVVFSAHGTEKRKIRQAEEKGIPYIETTCPVVENRLNIFSKKYNNQILFYYGKREHPETISFLENHPEAILLTKESFSLMKDGEKAKAILFTQSTLSREEAKTAAQILKEKNYVLEYISTPCPVFDHRLNEALDFLSDKKNFCFAVLGDKSSSNTQALYSGIKEMHKNCNGYILSSVNDIPKENRQSTNWYLACSTSISEESARDIYKALLFKSL